MKSLIFLIFTETPFRSSILNCGAIIYELLAFLIHIFYHRSAMEEAMICLLMMAIFCLLKSPTIIWWTFYTNEVNKRKDHQEETEACKKAILDEAYLRKVIKDESTVIPLENQDFVSINFLENVDFVQDFSSDLDAENLPNIHTL